MWGISSGPGALGLLPGLFWAGVVVPVRVPSMGQIELFNHLQYLKSLFVQTND